MFGAIYDALGIPDASGDEALQYGAQLGGTDFNFIGDEPQLVFRDAVTQLWYAVDDNGAPDEVYDSAGNLVSSALFNQDPTVSTFGSLNPTAVPVPAAAWLFGSGLLALFGFMRRK
jgi:hypothetical protein